MLYVIKKDGTREEFNPQKIVAAVNKSAERILYTFSDEEKDFICRFAQEHADSLGDRDPGDAQHRGGCTGAGESCSCQELPRLPELQAGFHPHDG